MKTEYNDILSRIKEPPVWWDENGTPRYNKFTPRDLGQPYSDECCLLLIDCQECSRKFRVAISSHALWRYENKTTIFSYSLWSLSIRETPWGPVELLSTGYITYNRPWELLYEEWAPLLIEAIFHGTNWLYFKRY